LKINSQIFKKSHWTGPFVMPKTIRRFLGKYRSLFFTPFFLSVLSCNIESIDDLNTTINSNSTQISGSVGDGPIVNAAITVTTKDNVMVTYGFSDDQAKYNIPIPNTTSYPLVISAKGGTDIVSNETPDFSLYSVITNPTQTTANLNPYSTLIYHTALKLSEDISGASIKIATEFVMNNFNFGLNTELVTNPIYSPISPTNVATMIKASEAFSEALRRTRDELLLSNIHLGIEGVLEQIAADIVDGKLDGESNLNVIPRIATTFIAISNSVLIETATNELYVNGQEAQSSLNAAVLTTFPFASASQNMKNVQITSQLISQLDRGITFLYSVTQNDALLPIKSIINTLVPMQYPSELRNLFSQDMLNTILSDIAYISNSSDHDIILFNSALSDQNQVVEIIQPVDSVEVSEIPEETELLISETSPEEYVWTKTKIGEYVYIDRSYRLTDIPATLVDIDMLVTANNDKTNQSTSFLRFKINTHSKIYLAYDTNNITETPLWLDQWTDTQQTITVDKKSMNLYSTNFDQGLVELGGNQGNNNSNMYIIFAHKTTAL